MARHKHILGKCTGKLAPVQQQRFDEYLSGLPCKHAVATIARLRRQNLKLENFAHKWLTMDAIRVTYGDSIKPVNSEEFWEETNRLQLEAPNIKRLLEDQIRRGVLMWWQRLR
ncbi:hypothetical protein Ahy_B06g080171 [Arachis hypogaea]|uniref:SWIM-type domain-containing protein n=1 Tax=Arachis hypogaea TaxID=3818 RepID=A0A444YH95_ARAHY|nr:hypothetical protein Ahy_B06g080171 [Arachis hypogaea]